ncbi:hypothetical protein G5I_13039 [Acromyrmex echinatior]|uniref:Uncharacterized protein n=1 Tax=Acromyrmex echinatior TaxID=103372 RepID=F4X3X6_ACREC|nr:hypothetical protein G5I_13039 [Acromyrmex echinatior]
MNKKKNESSTVILAGQYPRGHDNPSAQYDVTENKKIERRNVIFFFVKQCETILKIYCRENLRNKASSMTRLESRHRKTTLRKSEQHHKARGQALMARYFRLRRQDGITVNHLGLPKIILLDYQNNYIRRLSVDDNAVKSSNTLAVTGLSVLYNYSDGIAERYPWKGYSTRNIEIMDFMEKWPLCQIACKMPELRLERPRKSGSDGETDPHRWHIFPPEVNFTTVARLLFFTECNQCVFYGDEE